MFIFYQKYMIRNFNNDIFKNMYEHFDIMNEVIQDKK